MGCSAWDDDDDDDDDMAIVRSYVTSSLEKSLFITFKICLRDPVYIGGI
jgi:hypothetical protein